MTTGLIYSNPTGTNGYLENLATMAVVDSTDPAFVQILPMAITYAENRIYRDVDFLSTVTTNSTFNLTIGSRKLSVPAGTLVVCEQLNIITPVGTTNPDLGIRNQCLPVTKEFLDVVYSDSSFLGLPTYFAPFNDNLFLVGPFPDQSYQVELVGTIRPVSLSMSTTSTFISSYLPDLFMMASMVYISAYQRNFGRESDDPQMAQSYENQYQTLLASTQVEEARKKFESSGWVSKSPAKAASPSRG